MSLRFPTFNLTPAETASLEAVIDLLAEGARILHRPGPMLGRHDYAAALRLVRDATAYSSDLLALAAEEEGETDDEEEDEGEEEEDEEGEVKKKKKVTKESAYAASCALLKGDALRGLGRFADAANAYREAATTYDVEDIPSVGPPSSSSFSHRDGGDDDSDSSDEEEAEPHIDRGAAGLAARHLADLEGRRFFLSSLRRRRRRAGGLWNAHDVAGAPHRADVDEEEAGRRAKEEVMEALRVGSSGRRTEYWDPEPALVLRSVAQHQPTLTLVDRPAVRAAAGAVPAVVVGVAAASGRRVHGPKRAVTSTMIATTTTRPSTSSGGGGSWLPSGNPRVAATTAPRGQEQPPRPLRRRKSTSQDLKALLQAQTGDQHGSSGQVGRAMETAQVSMPAPSVISAKGRGKARP